MLVAQESCASKHVTCEMIEPECLGWVRYSNTVQYMLKVTHSLRLSLCKYQVLEFNATSYVAKPPTKTVPEPYLGP
jgi:hypothetical protein